MSPLAPAALLASCALLLLLLPSQATADRGRSSSHSDSHSNNNHHHAPRFQNGTIRCGGNHFTRLGNTELHFVNYIFRNRGHTHNITINRITFYDATGLLIYDTAVNGFPMFSNQVLGPNDQTLTPNQTGQLDVTSFLPFLTEVQRPMQAEISWSAPRAGLALSVDLIRLVQAIDPVTKARGAEKTRDSQDCDEITKL